MRSGQKSATKRKNSGPGLPTKDGTQAQSDTDSLSEFFVLKQTIRSSVTPLWLKFPWTFLKKDIEFLVLHNP